MPDPLQDLQPWLRLVLTPGVGNATARRLLAAFGPPENIFCQSRAALQQLVTPAQASALLTERLARQALGSCWTFQGFLAMGRGGKGLVFHIQDIQQN